MRKITIIALHHKLQWRDTDAGDLESLLTKVLEGDPSIELIAEEANKLPTTVGQRIAFRFNTPWAPGFQTEAGTYPASTTAPLEVFPL
jgi:hypothetical protein